MIAGFDFDHKDWALILVGCLTLFGTMIMVGIPAWLAARRTKTRNGMSLGQIADSNHTTLAIINAKADTAIDIAERASALAASTDLLLTRHIEEVAPLADWVRQKRSAEEAG